MTPHAKLLLIVLSLVLLASSSSCERPEADLDDATLARHATIGPYEPRSGQVITDNDASFAEKLRLVDGARTSIDMLYFIYHDDYTSSVLSKALLDAAARGVDVRMIVDYNTNYRHLDLYTMLESEAASGPGSIQIRFYNRPTRRIVEDAVYMTIGCSEVLSEDDSLADCDQRKFDYIERAFAEEEIEPAGLISNLNLAESGLFLSGLMGRRPDAMALAVVKGQDLDFEELKGSGSGGKAKSLSKLAKIYWRSRKGPLFTRVLNKIQLSFAHLRYGGEIREFKNTLTSLLPAGRFAERGGWEDWEYQSDFQHQKFLLADGERLLSGGRNIGDSYHMRPNPMLEHGGEPYFSDTEISQELTAEDGQKFREAFERMWDFRQMVASSEEVRQHAPNDFITNKTAYKAAKEACESTPEEQREDCVEREFEDRELSIEQRQAAHREEMLHRAEEYHSKYTPTPADAIPAPFELDAGARAYYIENVPYDKDVAASERRRLFGAHGLEEDASGKYLHLLWRRGLTNACLTASAEEPKRVLMLNPYYLAPGALLRASGWMVDGTLDCRHVTVQVLTNSMETNNFKVINPLGQMSLKAFSEFYHQQSDPEKRATFDFYEYREKPELPNFTLHSKVSILGDDIIIGSANVDARSYMMDANNGILFRDAPGMRAAYAAFIDAQIEDPQLVTRIDEYLRTTSPEQMRAEKRQLLRDYIASFGVDEKLNEAQQAVVDKALDTLLNQAYELTHAVLRGEKGAIDKYNRIFKFL